jgi:hypothetical protein
MKSIQYMRRPGLVLSMFSMGPIGNFNRGEDKSAAGESKYEYEYEHRLITGGIGHNLPQSPPHPCQTGCCTESASLQLDNP